MNNLCHFADEIRAHATSQNAKFLSRRGGDVGGGGGSTWENRVDEFIFRFGGREFPQNEKEFRLSFLFHIELNVDIASPAAVPSS